jgi:YesN/AraC family two-component response regulator
MKKESPAHKALIYVLKCPLEDVKTLSVEGIAKAIKSNRTYLSATFGNRMKCTLEEVIINEKISRSKEILKTSSGIPIKDLATMMGFSESNYFIKIFRKRVGIPPGEYRKLWR